MLHRYLKIILLALFVCALFFAQSCSSLEGKEAKEHEIESEPEGEVNSPQHGSLAKVTGVSFLANVAEIGLFYHCCGRITCMVIDKTDSMHFIAGAATGGLWTTHNRGRTWAHIDDQLPTLNIRSVCQNPIQTNTYYASAYTSLLNTPSTTVYRPDIYKSTDGGVTFQLIPATAGNFSTVIKVVCSPVNQNTVYALSDQLGSATGLYRSTNNAQTFTQVLPTNDVTDLEVLPDGTVLVAAGAQVYRSTTGNAGTFALVNGLNGANTFTDIDLSFCQSQPQSVYGVSSGGNSGVGVFKSTDGGLNWSFLQSITTTSFQRATGVKPDNPAFFFAGGTGLYLSQTSGSAFQFYGVGGVDWWSVNFDPHNANKVFMTFDQGIVEVNLNPFNPNNNTAYVYRDSLLNSAQIYAGDYFPTGDRVVVGMQDLGTYMAWPGVNRSLASGDGGYCYYHKQDTTIAYGSYQNGGIFKKLSIQIPFPQPGFTQPQSILNQLDANNDGTVDEGAFFIHPFWVNDADGEQLYFPTKKRLWRSINGGTNWVPISNFYNLPANSAEMFMDGNKKVNPTIYWSVMDTLYVMPNAKTAVAGNEFKVKLPFNIRWVGVDPANDSFVYITSYTSFTGNRVYHSSNLFKPNVQWTNLTGDMPDQIAVRSILVNPADKNQMIAGTSSGLYASSNGGAHWDRDMQLPNVSILRMAMRPSDKRLFVFTYGRGAWAANFPTSNNVVENTAPQRNLEIYPNPAQTVVHVGIQDLNSNTSLQVLSIDGKVLKVIRNIQYSPCAVNISDLAPGSYIVALYDGGDRVKTARLIKN